MSTINVVNPGLVNVADQGDGLVTVDQPVTVSPSMTAQTSVDAGTASPTSPNTINSTENTVIDQPASTEQFFDTISVYP
jgi:hypothetical protein